MNEIIKITENDGIETVNARELHNYLGSKRDFPTWITDRINKYGFIKEVDFTTIRGESSGGRLPIEYHISIDMAKELSMVENNERGREARRYFISREKQAIQLSKTNQIDYHLMGQVIGAAVSAAMTPIIEKLTNNTLQIEPPKEDYFSLLAYCSLHNIKTNRSELAIHGKELRTMTLSKGLVLKKIPDERWGQVNSYPVEILDEYFRV